MAGEFKRDKNKEVNINFYFFAKSSSVNKFKINTKLSIIKKTNNKELKKVLIKNFIWFSAI